MDDQAGRLLGLAELMTVAPRSGAASLAKVLPNLPTAVRAAATMTTSSIFCFLSRVDCSLTVAPLVMGGNDLPVMGGGQG